MKDVPSFLAAKVTRQNITSSASTWAADYKKAHIDTGSFAPMRHVLIGVFALAYTVAWPQARSAPRAAAAASGCAVKPGALGCRG